MISLQRLLRLVILAPLLAAGAACVAPITPAPNSPISEVAAVQQAIEPPAPLIVSDLTQIAQLTGAESMNSTLDRFGIAGTDLGHTFDMDGRLYMLFGDTFGCCIPGTGGPGNAGNWRRNTMAVIDDRDPGDGLAFATMIMERPGYAKQLVAPGRDDVTLIPTNAIAIGERMYMHYMGVRAWGAPGHWELNASGFAWSDDKGQSWTKEPAATWPGDSNFGQVALARKDGYLYLLGIPGGRFGGVQLARVPEGSLLDMASYHYFSGMQAGAPVWSQAAAEGATVVPAPVGELSTLWNPYLNRWIMTYLNEQKAALVIRSAAELWGPWSEESILVSGADYPQLYGAFLHPWLTADDGETIYFTMSLWQPYNVFLMRARLAPGA